MAKAKEKKDVKLHPIKEERILVNIKGLAPLIMHVFNEKTLIEFTQRNAGETVTKEKNHTAEEDFLASMYWLKEEGGLDVGFPASAFKQCTVRGGYNMGLVMTELRSAFFIRGIYVEKYDQQLVPIEGTIKMRRDMVRLSGIGRNPDVRYRGQVSDWKATLDITLNTSMLSKENLVNAIHAGGYGVGVGEWRPEKDGDFGRFEVTG